MKTISKINLLQEIIHKKGLKMKKFALILLGLSLTLIYGCAVTPQQNINLTEDYWEISTNKVGVYVTNLPEIKGHIVGAGCLLCIAVASGINAPLDEHMKTLDYGTLSQLNKDIIDQITQKGKTAKDVSEAFDISTLPDRSKKELGYSNKDFASLREELDVDELLVINLDQIGSLRTFASYIAVGDPTVIVKGSMYIVDMNDNSLRFFENIDVSKFSEEEWNEEPNYPGITNAYYTALEVARLNILDFESAVLTPDTEQ